MTNIPSALPLGAVCRGGTRALGNTLPSLRSAERCQTCPGSQALALLVYSCSGMLCGTQVGAAAVQQAWGVRGWWSRS